MMGSLCKPLELTLRVAGSSSGGGEQKIECRKQATSEAQQEGAALGVPAASDADAAWVETAGAAMVCVWQATSSSHRH